MTLSENEVARYARHIVLADVGGPGQQRLKAARVLVVGAGGLGAPLLQYLAAAGLGALGVLVVGAGGLGAPLIQYLAAAGIGTLGIVDDDTVALSNLQRQVVHDTAAIGRPKVESARDAVARLNPHVA